MTPEPITVKIDKAAGMLDQSERTVRRLIDRGELQAVHSGRSLLVLVASIHAYINRLLQKQQAQA